MSLISDSESTKNERELSVALPSSEIKHAPTIELEQFSIDVQSLMRGLVHELRNPLAAILTASTLLGGTAFEDSEALVDEESAMLLEVVSKEAKRMNAILTEFSAFVKPPPPNPESFDAAKTLRSLVEQSRRDGKLDGVVIVDELPATLNVYADCSQVEKAFGHVLENAAEELKGKGEIVLSGIESDNLASISIVDSGAGADPDALEKAFQPFFSRKPASTGLGLCLARGAIRASGGEITFKNRTDRSGVHVLVVLPINQTTEPIA